MKDGCLDDATPPLDWPLPTGVIQYVGGAARSSSDRAASLPVAQSEATPQKHREHRETVIAGESAVGTNTGSGDRLATGMGVTPVQASRAAPS